MDMLGYIMRQADIFSLVLARVAGVLVMAPFFGGQRIPAQVRLLFSIILAALITLAMAPQDTIPGGLLPYGLGLVTEFFVGFAIGFVTYLVFVAVQLCGQLVDMQIGFSIVNVIDPQSGIQLPLMGNFQYLLALLILLAMNGHHLILAALVKSYDFIPLLGGHLAGPVTQFILTLFSGLFVTAIKIAAPVVGALLVTDVALGIVARTVPQMNVFIVGMPAKILVGLVILILILPLFIWLLGALFDRTFHDVDILLRLLGGQGT